MESIQDYLSIKINMLFLSQRFKIQIVWKSCIFLPTVTFRPIISQWPHFYGMGFGMCCFEKILNQALGQKWWYFNAIFLKPQLQIMRSCNLVCVCPFSFSLWREWRVMREGLLGPPVNHKRAVLTKKETFASGVNQFRGWPLLLLIKGTSHIWPWKVLFSWMMALLCLPPSTRLDAKKRDYERFWNFTTFHSCLNQNKNRKENIEFNAVDSLGRTRFMKACIMGHN